MEKKKAVAVLLASTIIWAIVLVGSAKVLGGTEYKEAVNRVIFVGIIVHIQLMNMMLLWSKKKKKDSFDFKPGVTIIASAIIWGAVMIASASVLRGTEYKAEIARIIQGGSAAHLLFIWAPIGIATQKYIMKQKKKSTEE